MKTEKRIRSVFQWLFDKPMHTVTSFLMQSWRKKQLAAGKSPATVNRDLADLKAMFSKAVELGIISSHPLAKLKPAKTEDNSRVRFLSPEEEKQLFAALENREVKAKAARTRFNEWRQQRRFEPLPEIPKGNFVASVEVTPVKGVLFGASYISDLAESDIELVYEDSQLGNVYNSSVPRVGAFVSLEFGDLCFAGEYLTAARSFSRRVVAAAEEHEGELTGRDPRAWNLELAYTPLEHWEFALRSEGAQDFQEDVNRYGASVFHGLMEHVEIRLEYLYADAKGEDNDPSHTVTGQLAFEF